MNRTEYLLVCLMEEAAEVQQIASKCLRFGLDSYHPDHQETSNRMELQREIVDLDSIKLMLAEEGVIDIGCAVAGETGPKIKKVQHYMQISLECGTLQAAQTGEGEK